MIRVTVTDAVGSGALTAVRARTIVRAVCAGEKVRIGELSFVILNDGRIRTINRKFLGHDYVTDVITFPLEEEGLTAEIFINVRQAARQAKEYGVSLKNELTRLVVHGTLHALGYSDTTKAERERMHRVQERYVTALDTHR